jgi:hypothetical protein
MQYLMSRRWVFIVEQPGQVLARYGAVIVLEDFVVEDFVRGFDGVSCMALLQEGCSVSR